MGRRPHRKSRRGCLTCKRRHIRCDERRPSCINCSTAQLGCAYAEEGNRRSTANNSPASLESVVTPGPTQSSRSTSATLPCTPPIAVADPSSAADHVNMRHMELLSHFLLETCQTFAPGLFFDLGLLRVTMSHALATPYLMYEILAFTALHQSRLRPAQAKELQQEATSFQTQALALFNNTAAEITADNCVPMLLYSSLLGKHMLADAINPPDGENQNFLDRLILSLEVHRGVRAVTASSWEIIGQSDIAPLLRASKQLPDGTSLSDFDHARNECNALVDLLEVADLTQTCRDACTEALTTLRRVYNAKHYLGQSEDGFGMLFAWPVMLPAAFTDSLQKRNPEALIILAYYAVLLHSYRDNWIIGNAGEMLIVSISSHLGSYWKRWLTWPTSALSTNTSSSEIL